MTSYHNAYRRAGGILEVTWGDDGYILPYSLNVVVDSRLHKFSN